MQVFYGADPEVFMTYEKKHEDDIFDPGLPYAMPPVVAEQEMGLKAVGGDDKHPVYITNKDFNVIGDGVALEVNLNRPCNSWQEMTKLVRFGVEASGELAAKLGLMLSIKSAVNFDFKNLVKQEWYNNERMLMGIIFGCNPDRDACATGRKSSTLDASEHPYRYGGGHIHFSGMDEFRKYPLPTVRLLAIMLGNWLLVKNFEAEVHRLQYYGKPGKYRVQKYKDGTTGIEYRSPSNQWLNYSDTELEEMFSITDRAFAQLSDGSASTTIEKYLLRTVQAFERRDVSMAQGIVEELG